MCDNDGDNTHAMPDDTNCAGGLLSALGSDNHADLPLNPTPSSNLVGIKPLEWVSTHGGKWLRARTPVGVYEVRAGDRQIDIAKQRAFEQYTAKVMSCLSAIAPEDSRCSSLSGTWLPIELADKAITDIQDFPEVGMTIKTSDRYWVRDEDGRVYEAAWSEGKYGRDFWWDFEAESPVDPVEFMPHPLDPRFTSKEASDV